MNVYCFGVVDAASDDLTAMCYLEEDGKKGSNNVASMLWENLVHHKQIGLLGAVKEINLVFDNCVGQNKNNMVLRMLLLLVYKKICVRARAIFLVRGHTKNDADRAYNLLKLLYRKQNVYMPEDLWGALNNQEKCE